MKPTLRHILVRFLKISGIAIGSILALLFLLPYLFPGFISGKIKQWARSSIKSELNFSAARLSFFKHFPALTLTLYDLSLKGSAPFEKETLVEADEIALGVDLRSVFSRIQIDKIFLTNAFINIQVDAAGNANYNIYSSGKSSGPSDPSDSSSASLKIKKILIEKSKLVYNDRSLPMLINAKGLYYKGNGDLSEAIFDLNSHTEIDSMDFYYDRQAYFLSKKINADLVTRINTNSLALLFDRNDLTINQLPVTFTGRFEFLKNGYDMDFRLQSKDAYLHDILTAMPPGMLDWLSRTEVKGSGDIDATLKGKYIASSNTMPDLNLGMKIRDGFVASSQAPYPVKNLFLDLKCGMPGLNPDSVSLTVDSLFFNIGKDYFSAILKWQGMKSPTLSARLNSEIDLEKWDKATGFGPADLKGRYTLHLEADGRYATRVVRTTTLRKTVLDTVITSIPRFTLRSSLKNGYFKFASRPEAIGNIGFDLDASCPDHDYRHARLDLTNINATALSSYIKGFLRVGGAADVPVDAGLETVLHLSDIKKLYPLDSMVLAGDLRVHVQAKGNYQPSKKLFPVTVASLQLDNGALQTKYYPHPLEKIQASAKITSNKGSVKDLEISLTPVSFEFEGKPFMVRADLQNFDNLKYSVVSRGLLDIGKIYRVFALPGYDLKGLVEANVDLRGRQSDAMAGRYDLLFNSGTLKVKDLQLSTELFPLPFLIRNGLFRFDQDKMWFDAFAGNYGKSDLTLNGYLSNVINYALNKNAPLKGNFDLKSNFISADEFTAFASPGAGAPAPKTVAGDANPAKTAGGPQPSPAAAPAAQTGVVMVPG
ncbi:MAG TPA: hypothetical protein VK563_04125, partial [Puia sp.]|nr:hypothetical protein [Puia sp.]